jgi:hypothetical protein
MPYVQTTDIKRQKSGKTVLSTNRGIWLSARRLPVEEGIVMNFSPKDSFNNSHTITCCAILAAVKLKFHICSPCVYKKNIKIRRSTHLSASGTRRRYHRRDRRLISLRRRGPNTPWWRLWGAQGSRHIAALPRPEAGEKISLQASSLAIVSVMSCLSYARCSKRSTETRHKVSSTITNRQNSITILIANLETKDSE